MYIRVMGYTDTEYCAVALVVVSIVAQLSHHAQDSLSVISTTLQHITHPFFHASVNNKRFVSSNVIYYTQRVHFFKQDAVHM